jgi:GNAT superfamily N-acetyltransferase
MEPADSVRAGAISYRRATSDDVGPAYAVFRRSLFDYLFRLALVDEATAKDAPIESGWARQQRWIDHLWATAAENWVATEGDGKVVGWAMSTERDGVLELTHFFVEPGIQARGVGRALLERAFPMGSGRHRVIVATQDAPALALYLRFDVGYVTTSVDLIVKPAYIPDTSDLVFERLGTDEAAVGTVAQVEQAVLGHRRDPDVQFLLGLRPAWVARRSGDVVGFGFGPAPRPGPSIDDGPVASGPMAALDPADLPAIIDHVVSEAASADAGEFTITCPMSNRTALLHLLRRGYRIDPFYIKVLADDDSMRLDRWIHTGPVFII